MLSRRKIDAAMPAVAETGSQALDSSASGKARSAPAIDGWGRQIPGSASSLVAPAQAVTATGQPRRVRGRQKDGQGATSPAPDGSDRQPASQHMPSPHLGLQAVDPQTGTVVWQASLSPDDDLADAGWRGQGISGATEPAQLSGLLGKRAYDVHIEPDDERPSVSKTA